MNPTACSLEVNVHIFLLNMCGKQLAETSLQKKKGINKKTPAKLAAQQLASRTKGNTTEWTSQKTSSLNNNKNKNCSKKVSLGQTLAQSKSLSREAKQRGVKQKLALPGVQLMLLSLRGSLTSFSEQDGATNAGRRVMIPKLAGTTPSSTSSTTNNKLGNQQARCSSFRTTAATKSMQQQLRNRRTTTCRKLRATISSL